MRITIRQPLTFSEIGRKDNQEDRVYPLGNEATTQNRVFVLCDGMGGHENGEVASETVSQALGKYLDNLLKGSSSVTADMFREALTYAYDELDKRDTGGFKKMGTTMTCLCLHNEGYLVAHIGDSRIYHIRPSLTDAEKGRQGIIYQSSDHSLVNDLLRAGELTEEEAQNFPQKNIITRAMQPNLERRHKADIYSFTDIKAGDYFFLCCDGVLEQLTNEQLCTILSDTTLNDEQKLSAIKSVCDGNTKDNYTCYLIPIENVISEEGDKKESNDIIQGLVVDVEDEPSSEKQSSTKGVPSPKVTDSKKKQPFAWWKIIFPIVLVGGIAYFMLGRDNTDNPTGDLPDAFSMKTVAKDSTTTSEEENNEDSSMTEIDSVTKTSVDTLSSGNNNVSKELDSIIKSSLEGLKQ